MSWISPLKTESDLLDLFRELGKPYRRKLIQYAWHLAHPDHFLGGPIHGQLIDECNWRGEDDPSEIAVAYDAHRVAVYAKDSFLGIYVFRGLRLIGQVTNTGGADE